MQRGVKGPQNKCTHSSHIFRAFSHKTVEVGFIKYRTERSDPYQDHVLDTFCTSTNTRSTFRFCLILAAESLAVGFVISQ